ncbi:PREDICTED: 4F2 cell-surface antigen heavy chain [Chrysochloris asiatica]|uniref:4F2 cell-surface antigen heavy chain n=1 Tax=Chrysochloris asiatica TaxID=185453 RepID=A0A9B0U145_CHRAS|nr:PREDICTED: 4F2 cell-surface antigen heavy chain [Chrysochloris asiatica]
MDPAPPESSADVVSAPRPPPVELTRPADQCPSAGGDSGTMSHDAEVDLKEVELNELEPEKQPMNAASGAAVAMAVSGGAEKNGLVKIKVADDEETAAAKFTGLSKEELLKVAGSPGWVRTRWALLVLFWLGWLGMLAGAVVIIVQAPRCRELPIQRWWHKGALYRIADIQAFLPGEGGKLADLKGHLNYLSSLKVKGIVLGPIHNNLKDDVLGTNLGQIDPALGSKEDFDSLLQSAKKKSIRVILDLTPNYRGQNSWFLPTEVNVVTTKMKRALEFWLQSGVDGFQVRNVENLTDASLFLTEWQNITQSVSEERLLIAGTDSSNLQEILELLNSTSDAMLLTSSYLASPKFAKEHPTQLVTQYVNATSPRWCSWTLSQAGLLTSFVPASLLQLYQLLLFTLPGTPVFTSGDEIGLQAAALPDRVLLAVPVCVPVMLWNESSLPSTFGLVNVSMTVKGQDSVPGSFLSVFRKLSDKRVKERSLLHGDFYTVSSGPGLFSYVRHWDQNQRFLVMLNFGDQDVTAKLETSGLPASASLPAKAELVLSTQPGRKGGTSLALQQLSLKPHEGLLLGYPYVA